MDRPNILVIDDDLTLCEMLRVALDLERIDVRDAHHVIEAERLLLERVPDAIVLDVGLPGVDGIFYCARLRESPRTAAVPIVAISGSEEAGLRATAAGANTFVAKPFDPLMLLTVVEQMIGTAPLRAFDDVISRDSAAAAELRRLIHIGHRQHELLSHAYRQTVIALAAALESRDFGTGAHSQRVTAYAMRLAIEVAPWLTDDPSLEWGFQLHDVGKIGIPDQVLLKPGLLDEAERREMERHTTIGEALLSRVPLLSGEGIKVVRSHHEHWDGSGYPDGLSGGEIPLGARIFSVADALDAITGDRPYRKPRSWDEALAELEAHSGTQFDPDILDGFAVCERDLFEIHSHYVGLALA